MNCMFPRAIAVLLASTAYVWAGDVEKVSVHELKSRASSLQLKLVAIEGTAKNLRPLPPHVGGTDGGCMVYGSYLFTLTDQNEEVDVQVSGFCNKIHAEIPVSEDDPVSVVGRVEFFHPGDFGFRDPTVRIEAVEVRRQAP